jgi:hypothetical protein
MSHYLFLQLPPQKSFHINSHPQFSFLSSSPRSHFPLRAIKISQLYTAPKSRASSIPRPKLQKMKHDTTNNFIYGVHKAALAPKPMVKTEKTIQMEVEKSSPDALGCGRWRLMLPGFEGEVQQPLLFPITPCSSAGAQTKHFHPLPTLRFHHRSSPLLRTQHSMPDVHNLCGVGCERPFTEPSLNR